MITLTITSTDKIAIVNGIPVRLWRGTTPKGVAVVCLIARVTAVIGTDDLSELDEGLAPSPSQECSPELEAALTAAFNQPLPAAAWPSTTVLRPVFRTGP